MTAFAVFFCSSFHIHEPEVMNMKLKLKFFLLCIAIPLFVGGLSGMLTQNSIPLFQELKKPPLAPPGYVFPIIWTVLFILMGIASYLVLSSAKESNDIENALFVYVIQLFVNFFWSIFFFRFGWYFFSFLWIILLWILIAYTIYLFYRISKPAALLMIPYLLWVTFAGYLNLAIYFLN